MGVQGQLALRELYRSESDATPAKWFVFLSPDELQCWSIGNKEAKENSLGQSMRLVPSWAPAFSL